MGVSGFQISIGTAEDEKVLLKHRLKMFEEIRPDKGSYRDDFASVTQEWVSHKLRDQNFVAFIARTRDGIIAGSGCILVKEDQPRPETTVTGAPYLLSMYTEPDFRKMGVATAIVKEAIYWSRKNGYDRIDLHASPIGRSVYERLGFRQTTEMRLIL